MGADEATISRPDALASLTWFLIQRNSAHPSRLFEVANANESERVQDGAILARRWCSFENGAGMPCSQASDAFGKVAAHMTALPQKDRHDSNRGDAVRDEIGYGCFQVRLHQFEECQSHRRGRYQLAHARDERLERLGPFRIARTMREQNQSALHASRASKG